MSATQSSDVPRETVYGMDVAIPLKVFVEEEVLPGTGVEPDAFWHGFAEIVEDLAPRNRELLDERAAMQSAIDGWHRAHEGQPHDADDYEAFLHDLGYLTDEGPDFTIDTADVDDELARVPGPQLVVPVTNARYAVNAVNARWGSLYDAVYGTDVLGDLPPAGPYDEARGKRVIAWGRRFLDETFPLEEGSHADVTGYRVGVDGLEAELPDGTIYGLAQGTFVGHVGEPSEPSAVLLRHHGLGVEIALDRSHPVGSTDRAGVADLVLEAAATTIMDLEDSVATVDTEDKVAAYRNWLGLMKGELTAEVHKDGRSFTRRMAPDRQYVAQDGKTLTVQGRSLMLVRNVGHLMTTEAVVDRHGAEIPEGFLDAMITVACALHDVQKTRAGANSSNRCIYVVKPKMHGPTEVAFTDKLFDRVEHVLYLAPKTVKLGLMDEERRTSVNLKECIRAARSRVAFINTGFLDRTGDEIHTSMEAGTMVRKAEMKDQPWIRAYEDRNVDIGLACGLPGRGQIGKGMWAAPERMAAMLEDKVGHPQAGATCAWVPSPTAATLHAIHYHQVDVLARQVELADRPMASLEALLTIPVATSTDWSDEERSAELENNAQGILGYVVRWIDHGIGCSKVPDINHVALMEDRATCRISSQLMANWLHHGVTTQDEVLEVMRRMARVVDEQNAGDPAYVPMAPSFEGHAFLAAVDLVLRGTDEPSGYTEPSLHHHRVKRKRSLIHEEPMNLTLDQARTIIEGALAQGRADGLKPLSVAVLDAGGHLTAFEREDGSANMRFQIAHAKAHGALALGVGSRALMSRAEDQPYFVSAAAAAIGGALIPVPGGVLIARDDGTRLGAVGVTGDTSDNDEKAAVAGVEAAGLIGETG